MPDRETAVSKTIEYETSKCCHCGGEVALDDIDEDIDIPDRCGNVVTVGNEATKRDNSVIVTGEAITVEYVCERCSTTHYDHDENSGGLQIPQLTLSMIRKQVILASTVGCLVGILIGAMVM